MKKIMILLLCALLLFASAGCANLQSTPVSSTPSTPPQTETAPPATATPPAETDALPSPTETTPPQAITMPSAIQTIPSNIPTNESVNIAWDGCMCEESGYIYYAFGKTGKEKIVRAKSDGSDPVTVTEGEYACLHELTADSANLYFVSSPGEDAPTGALDTIYRLPLGGGKEQAVTQGNVYSLQNANGKLYWVNDSGDDAPAKINCINMDGSDSKTLFTAKDLLIGSELLVAGGNIYYTDSAFTTPDSNGNGSAYSDLYRMDLGGGNAQKLCRTKTGFIDKLFYDQGKLYFLTEDTDVLNDSLQTLDAKGKAVTLLKNVGYFPQDFGAIEYCGISDNIFYYFTETEDSHSQTDVTDSTVYVYFDLHRFDLKTIRSTVLIHDMEMGDPAIGTLFSVRGKNIRNNGVTGFYILGNDIYFSPYAAS